MTALPTLAAGDVDTTNSDHEGETSATAPLQTIGAASDTSYIFEGSNSTGSTTAILALDDVPANFGTMDTLSVQYRYLADQITANKTLDSITIQILESDLVTPLTGVDTLTFAGGLSSPTATNTAVRSLSSVVLGDKATWDGAVVVIGFNVTRSMGGNEDEYRVSALELTGTYTERTGVNTFGSASLNGSATITAGVPTGYGAAALSGSATVATSGVTYGPFKLSASANIAALGENTTAQLTAGGGDFAVGRIQDDENPTDAVPFTFTKVGHTELEWAIEATNAALDATTYEFRVVRHTGYPDYTQDPLETYTVTPQWTIQLTLTSALPGPVATATLATPTLTQLNSVIPVATPITPTLPLATVSGPTLTTLPGPLVPTLPLSTTSVGPVTSVLPGPLTPTLEFVTTSVGPVSRTLPGPIVPTLPLVTTSGGGVGLPGPLTPTLPLITTSVGPVSRTLPGPITPTLPLVTLNTKTFTNLSGPVTPTLPLTELFALDGGGVAYIESYTTAATTGSATTLDIDAPAGIQYGDLIYIIATAGSSCTPDDQPVGETGWTKTDLTATTHNDVVSYYKIAGAASEPSTYTIDFNATEYASAIALRISGVDRTTPIEAQTFAANISFNPNPPSTGTLSATKAYLSLAFAAIEDASTTPPNLTPPSNYVELVSNRAPSNGATGSSLYVASQLAYSYEQNTNVIDPGAFSSDVGDGWNTFTTAINSSSQASNFIVLPNPVITPTLPIGTVYKETQPFIRGYSSAITSAAAATTTVTVDAPYHEPGDLIFLLLGSSSTAITATGPDGESGWTKGTYGDGFGGPDSDYYYKVAGASEPSTYTFTPGPNAYFTLSAIAVGNVHPTLSRAFSDVLDESIETFALSGDVEFDSNVNETYSTDKVGLIWAVMDSGRGFTNSINSTSNGWTVREIVEYSETGTTYLSTFWGSKSFDGTYEDMSSVLFASFTGDSYTSYNFAITGPPLDITLPGPITATLATPTLAQLNAVISLAPITPTLPLTTTSTGPVSRTLPGPLTPTLPLITTSVGPFTSTLPGPITPTLETTTTSVGPVFINLTGPLTPTLSTVTTSVGPARTTLPPVTPTLPLTTTSTGPVSRTLSGPVVPSLPAVTVNPGAYTSTVVALTPTLELITTSTGPVSRTLPAPLVPITVLGVYIYRLISLAGGGPTAVTAAADMRVQSTTGWSLDDPVTYEYYDFEINPSSGGTPTLSKSIVYQNTAASNNKTLVMKRAAEPPSVSVQGAITTQSQLDSLASWTRKRYPINLRDDLGRQYLIYVESFDVRRETSSDTPYSHTYTLTYFIVG